MPVLHELMDAIQQWSSTFNEFSKANPVVAGMVGVWGLTVLTMLGRGIPIRMWNFVKRQSTTTLTFTNVSAGNLQETFTNFLKWFHKGKWSRFSRQISIDSAPTSDLEEDPGNPGHYQDVPNGGRGTAVGPGNGSHFFMFRGWPFWMTRTMLAAGTGSMYQLNYEVTITTIGRNRQRVLDLIEEFRHRPKSSAIMVDQWDGNGWEKLAEVTNRHIDSVIIDEDVKNSLLKSIDVFLGAESWYVQRGLPYKLVILLHGPAGGGKTSLIRSLASTYRRGVSQISLNSVDDTTIYRALTRASDRSFIAIEDIDSFAASRGRSALLRKQDEQREKEEGKAPTKQKTRSRMELAAPAEESSVNLLSRLSPLTLSGLLNSLDGIASLHGKIIFLSTNIPEQLDPALLRKGRVDLQIEIGPLQQKEIHKYITLMFPDADIPEHLHFKPIMGCDIQSLYLENRTDANAFIQSIPKSDLHADLRLVQSQN